MVQILGPLLRRAAAEIGGVEPLRRSLAAVLERAARRAMGADVDVEIEIDVDVGTLSVLAFRSVVEGPAGADEIELQQAQAIDPDADLGDALGCAVELDALAPHVRGALVAPAEHYPVLEGFFRDLFWDVEVVRKLSRRPTVDTAVERLVATLREGPFAAGLRPGCDAVELHAHELMLGGSLPPALRRLLAGTAGMDDVPGAPRLSLGRAGFRLLSPLEAQAEHAAWTQRRDEVPPRGSGPAGAVHPAFAWNTDWLPIALGSRGAEPTELLLVDPIGVAADRPGELLCMSFDAPGWWALGLEVDGLAHLWLMLHERGLLVHRPPGVDPIATGKAEALVQHLMPRRRWVDAGERGRGAG
jgi:hypothetical protein